MIFALKVTLARIKPAIWRQIRVPGGMTLRELHGIIQVAMGWGNEHLHGFTIDGQTYGEPDAFRGTKNDAGTAIETVAEKGSRFVYTYDFGDWWEHQIDVEDVVADDGGPLPACTGGKRACPPEDCGGVRGYRDVLAALKEPTNPEHEERLEWLGDGFDPEAFDIQAINRQLAQIGNGLRDRLRLRALKEAARKRSGAGRRQLARR